MLDPEASILYVSHPNCRACCEVTRLDPLGYLLAGYSKWWCCGIVVNLCVGLIWVVSFCTCASQSCSSDAVFVRGQRSFVCFAVIRGTNSTKKEAGLCHLLEYCLIKGNSTHISFFNFFFPQRVIQKSSAASFDESCIENNTSSSQRVGLFPLFPVLNAKFCWPLLWRNDVLTCPPFLKKNNLYCTIVLWCMQCVLVLSAS